MEYQIQNLISLLECETKGETKVFVTGVSPFFQAKEGELTFASESKFLSNLSETKASVVIVPFETEIPNDNKMYILTKKNPRDLMPILLNFFKRKTKKVEQLIEKTATIDETASIMPNVYIGHDVKIGKNVTIFPNSTIYEGVEIGDNTIIYSNVTVREFCTIGKNCVVQPGAVIGSDGFGFVKVDGNNIKIEQIGTVKIYDFVEIGANTTIDRGTIGDTIIKSYTKIDNLVQIAHNDVIGENCIIIAQSGVAGSTEIGNNTTIAGQTGIAGHIKIGNNVTLGAKTGVTGNIKDNQVLSGNPPVPVNEHLKIKATMKKLPELLNRVTKLEKKINE